MDAYFNVHTTINNYISFLENPLTMTDEKPWFTQLRRFWLLGVFAYLPALCGYFLADDFHFIHDVAQHGLEAMWTVFPRSFFRPLVMFSFWLDHAIWPYQPMGYHLTNILFHGANAFLFFRITKIWLKWNQWPNGRIHLLAYACAFLFLLHPSHSEAVAWISGRSDVIATFWMLAALLTYMRFRDSGGYAILATSWALFACATLTKESVITFPLIIAAIEIFRRNDNCKPFKKWPPVLGYFIILAGCFMLRWVMLGNPIGGYGQSIHLRFDMAFLQRNMIFHTTRTLVPPIGGYNAVILQYGAYLLYASAALILLTILNRISRNLSGHALPARFELPDWMLAPIIFYVISVLPVLNLGIHLGTSLGERLIYWPSVFTLLLFCCIVDRIFRYQPKIALGTLSVIIVVCAAMLFNANREWLFAGTYTKKIIKDINKLPASHRLIVLNIPDTFNGAYMLRNGIQPAVEQGSETVLFEDIRPAVFQTIYSETDGVQVKRIDAHTYQVTASGPTTRFLRQGNTKADQAAFDFIDFQRRQFTVRIKNPRPGDTVSYFDSTNIIPIP
jgi:protein O-mannosyl-transferase